MGPASYAHHLPLPFQGMEVNEEVITHAPDGYHAGGPTPSGERYYGWRIYFHHAGPDQTLWT